MVHVVMVGVSVHQEFQASQEALDPREQQVLRDHLAIMDLKDPWAHEAMKGPVEDRDHQVPKELKAPQAQQVHPVTKVKQVLVEIKVPLAPRDLKDPQVQLVPLETRVIQALVEVKVPQVPRDLKDPRVLLDPMETRVIQVLVEVKVPQVQRVPQDRLFVIGNSAFSRI